MYLPIDPRNRCNDGYCFVNFTHGRHILRFYASVHGQRWGSHTSEKIAQVNYARIQGARIAAEIAAEIADGIAGEKCCACSWPGRVGAGKDALIAHFSHSRRLRYEDQSMQPLVWATSNGLSQPGTIPWHLFAANVPPGANGAHRGRGGRHMDPNSQ